LENIQTLSRNTPQPDCSDNPKKTTVFPAPLFMKLITSRSTFVVIRTEICLNRAKMYKIEATFLLRPN